VPSALPTSTHLMHPQCCPPPPSSGSTADRGRRCPTVKAPEPCCSLNNALANGALSCVHPAAEHGPPCGTGSATQAQHLGWLCGVLPLLSPPLSTCSLPSRGVDATSAKSSTAGAACAIATTSSSPATTQQLASGSTAVGHATASVSTRGGTSASLLASAAVLQRSQAHPASGAACVWS
jgi:hypothetical protein